MIYEQNNHKGLSVTASQQNYDRKFYIRQASLSRTQPQKQMCFVQVYANQEGLWVIIKLCLQEGVSIAWGGDARPHEIEKYKQYHIMCTSVLKINPPSEISLDDLETNI